MTKYKIKKGCAFAWPRPFGLINVNRTNNITLSLTLDKDSHIPKEVYEYINDKGEKLIDRDYDDGHKGPGLTKANTLNNHTSILLAYQFQDNGFGVMAYFNDKDGSIPKSFNFKRLEFGQTAKLVITNLNREGFNYKLFIEKEEVDAGSFQWKISKWFPFLRKTGCSFGGANNAPGPFGDKAPQEIKFKASF